MRVSLLQPRLSGVFAVCLLLLVPLNEGAEVTDITEENWNDVTFGKTVFIKFFAPWCGHCKLLAPIWEKVAEAWDGKEEIVIGEVDCTASKKNQRLCETHGIASFPTLKYGDPTDLIEYEGARTLEALTEFANQHMVPLCSPVHLELCPDDKKQEIETLLKMPQNELLSLIAAEEMKLKQAKAKFDQEVDALQEKYQALEKERDEAIRAIQKQGLPLMHSVNKAMEAVKGTQSANNNDEDEGEEESNDDKDEL